MESSIMKRAQEKGLFTYTLHNLTDWTTRNTRRVDDRPYGGGAGTIIMIEPLTNALREIMNEYPTDDGSTMPIYLMAPSGNLLKQRDVHEHMKKIQHSGSAIIICGHYEGVDERIFELFDINSISI